MLLVENDSYLAERLETALSKENYVVDLAQTASEAEGFVDTLEYDLVLTEVARPRIDGIRLCKQLRSQGKHMPIMLLTDEGDAERQLAGLDAGADDYVVSPCDLSELMARIRALLRRGSAAVMEVLEWRALALDTGSCEVTYDGFSIGLTRKEYGILELFMRNTRRIYSQSALLDLLWSFEEPPGENTVRAHIKSLRQKLKRGGVPTDFIETVYGMGYRLRQPPEGELAALSQASSPLALVSSQSSFSPLSTEVAPANSEEVASYRECLDPELADIWEQAQGHIQERLGTIEQAIAAIKSQTLAPQQRQEAHRQAHTLVGSLGALGLPRSSQLIRSVQQCLRPDLPLDSSTIERLEQSFAELATMLSQLVVEPVNGVGATDTRDIVPSASLSVSPRPASLDLERDTASEGYQLLIVDDDVDLAALISLEASKWGIQAHTAASIDQARQAIGQHPPDVVLLDLGFPDSADSGFTLLEELATQNTDIPVVVFTASEDFATRVKVVRLGGQAFLQKPVLPRQVLEAISQILEQGEEADAKVVVVDTDPRTLDLVRTVLQPWGFQLVLVDDPAQFWETLVAATPDLLILASDMPDIDGIDLCQVVRNDPQWGSLPVLFLADGNGSTDINGLFAAGGNDYVRKPITEPELVARVLSQLERSSGNGHRDTLDPVTGIMGRRRSLREFSRLLYLASRHHQPLSLVVVKVNNLAEIEQSFGQIVSHQVLKRVADELQGNLRQEDIVARWETDTFAVCAYDMDRFNGIRRLSSILGRLQSQPIQSGEDEVKVQLSCGIAEYGDRGQDLYSLYRAATEDLAVV
ncbi:MAG: response regulator [Cyanobacteria bacterium P01_E01_bin.45]